MVVCAQGALFSSLVQQSTTNCGWAVIGASQPKGKGEGNRMGSWRRFDFQSNSGINRRNALVLQGNLIHAAEEMKHWLQQGDHAEVVKFSRLIRSMAGEVGSYAQTMVANKQGAEPAPSHQAERKEKMYQVGSPICAYCHSRAGGPMLVMDPSMAHIHCVISKLNELLGPDYDGKGEPASLVVLDTASPK